MNVRAFFFSLAAAAGAVYLIKTLSGKGQKRGGTTSVPPKGDNSQVVHLVEETLHQHEGEDNPIVHAFEAALKQETKHDNGLVSA